MAATVCGALSGSNTDGCGRSVTILVVVLGLSLALASGTWAQKAEDSAGVVGPLLPVLSIPGLDTRRELQSCVDRLTWCSSWRSYCTPANYWLWEGQSVSHVQCPVTCGTCSRGNPPAGGGGGSCRTDCDNNRALLNLVNGLRAQNGRRALCLNEKLSGAAKVQADHMNRINVLTHTGPGNSNIGQRVTASGFSWNGAGENVAWNYPTVQRVYEGWLNSPGHRANMLGDFTHMGAFKTGPYWAQVFGKSSSEACNA